MKQEDKDLLIQDLCARLPYGVKMQKSNEQNIFVDLYAINLNNYTIDFYTYKGKSLTIGNTSKLARFGILLYKPCLFPLSSMTEEQKEELNKCIKQDYQKEYDNFVDNISNGIMKSIPMPNENVIEFYHKNHFDYRGLIPMGLAIDCTNLNIY